VILYVHNTTDFVVIDDCFDGALRIPFSQLNALDLMYVTVKPNMSPRTRHVSDAKG